MANRLADIQTTLVRTGRWLLQTLRELGILAPEMLVLFAIDIATPTVQLRKSAGAPELLAIAMGTFRAHNRFVFDDRGNATLDGTAARALDGAALRRLVR